LIGGYEDTHHVRNNDKLSGESQPTFRKNMPPLSVGWEIKSSKKVARSRQMAATPKFLLVPLFLFAPLPANIKLMIKVDS
jgi:hypothetical protein